jgi:hypothetical protein
MQYAHVMAMERDPMMKIFGTLFFSGAVLAGSTVMADNDKRTSGRDGVQCIDGGERECGIAWEGKGLFNISARARFAFRPIWSEDLDLQQAYLCCTEDQTRKNICNQTHTWVTWDHCEDYVLKFFDPKNEEMINYSGQLGDALTGGAGEIIIPSAYPTWTEGMRELTRDIYQSKRDSASAQAMYSCMEESSSFAGNEINFLKEQVNELFDVVTIVDLPLSLGALFAEKGALSAITSSGETALNDVEKSFVLNGARFSENELKNEITYRLVPLTEIRNKLMQDGADETKEQIEMALKSFEGHDPNLDIIPQEGEKSWAELLYMKNTEKDNLFFNLDKRIISHLTSDIRAIAAERNDLNMLLGRTRRAINDSIEKKWLEIVEKTWDIEPMQVAIAELSEGKNERAFLESLLPFKDDYTDFGIGNMTEKNFKDRFSDIIEMRHSDVGFSEENIHAIKFGYWDSVKPQRMSSNAIRQAEYLEKIFDKQIDSKFINILSEYSELGLEAEEQDLFMQAVLENRLSKISQKSVSKIWFAAFKGLFKLGTLNLKLASTAYQTEKRSEGCIAAIFDNLRDHSTCLWNNAEGELCDE